MGWGCIGAFDPHAFWHTSECGRALLAAACGEATLEGANGLRGWAPGWIGSVFDLVAAELRNFPFYLAFRLDSRRGDRGIHLFLSSQLDRDFHAAGCVWSCSGRHITALAPLWCVPIGRTITVSLQYLSACSTNLSLAMAPVGASLLQRYASQGTTLYFAACPSVSAAGRFRSGALLHLAQQAVAPCRSAASGSIAGFYVFSDSRALHPPLR